jgi:hypothetical protein
VTSPRTKYPIFFFYVLEYFLKKPRKKGDSLPPEYQSTAWKEFSFDAVPIHQIPEKKTLIHDDYQTEFDSTEAEIGETEKRIQDLRNEIERIKTESQGMEDLFIQVAPLVKWKWIEPGCTKEPQGKDKLFRLKYWLT